MNKLKAIIVAAAALLILTIILQNTQAVETKVLFLKITMPRAFLLIITFLAGFAVGVFTIIGMTGKSDRAA